MDRDRRSFLGAAAALAGGPLLQLGRGAASDRIRVGIVGMGGRGNSLMKSLHRIASDNVEVVALCDVDSAALASRAKDFERLTGRRAATFGDMRKLLEDKSIDAVVHTTPDNWHAVGGAWTMQAGKDAYIEKPLALTLWEGEKVVEAARKHRRIVQHGTQSRSSPEILEGMEQLRRGVIGEIYMARGIGHKYRPSIGREKPSDPPASLNYEMWRGPAPMKPYKRNQVRYDWHWFWDTGTGDLGNLAVHGLDVMRMAFDLKDLPEQVQSAGANLVWDDDKETPNFQTCVYNYKKRKVLLEYSIRNGHSNSEAGMGESIPMRLGNDKWSAHGLVIYGSEGYMVLADLISYRTYLGRARKPGPARIGAGLPESNEPHLQNFFKAVRSRRHEDLNADVEEGRRSAALCHLANISYRVGATLQVDPRTEKIANRAAEALRRRPLRAPYTIPAVV
jgi:predicted dehydrogenase